MVTVNPTRRRKTATPQEEPPAQVKPRVRAMAGPYPAGTKLFSYQPENGGPVIELPLDLTNVPDKLFFWELHQYRGRPDLQMFMWFDRFNVPKSVQRYAVTQLTDAEFVRMCDAWWDQMKGGTSLGE